MKFIPLIKKHFPLITLSALGGFIGGLFGSGGGILFVFILKKYFGNDKTIFATTILLTLFTSALNSTVYSRAIPSTDYSPWGFLGGGLGAIVGCLLFEKIKLRALNLVFSLLIIISGIIMILKG